MFKFKGGPRGVVPFRVARANTFHEEIKAGLAYALPTQNAAEFAALTPSLMSEPFPFLVKYVRSSRKADE